MPGVPVFKPHMVPHDIDGVGWWDRLFAALPDVVFCIKDLEFGYRSAIQPIADIALASGYSDQSSFTRQFHVAVGLPPAAYRVSHTSL